MKQKTTYAEGQHRLICEALNVSPDPNAPGDTAYEAVCVLLTKLHIAKGALKTAASGRMTETGYRFVLKELRKKTFPFLQLFGTEPKTKSKTVRFKA